MTVGGLGERNGRITANAYGVSLGVDKNIKLVGIVIEFCEYTKDYIVVHFYILCYVNCILI